MGERMKPDWSKAPHWAAARAIDDDGGVYWFEFAPVLEFGTWYSDGTAELERFINVEDDFDPSTTLELRPA